MILILDAGGGPLPPYPQWLAGAGDDLVLLTGRSRPEIDRSDVTGYAQVRCYPDYATSALVERDAVALAGRTPVGAVVAVAGGDAVRAGSLRDHLGLAGEGRAAALARCDLVAQRCRLGAGGLATVAHGAVHRVADLYWYGHRWGYPLRVRRRRVAGWPTVVRLVDEADVMTFSWGGLSTRLEAVPDLMVEPAGNPGHRLALRRSPTGVWERPGCCPAPVPALATAALARLGAGDGCAARVDVVRRRDEDGWRVDAVAVEVVPEPAVVTGQAGLGPVPAAVAS